MIKRHLLRPGFKNIQTVSYSVKKYLVMLLLMQCRTSQDNRTPCWVCDSSTVIKFHVVTHQEIAVNFETIE